MRFFYFVGVRCDGCASGYYGNPEQDGGVCQPCNCNNNIDMSDPLACDKQSGVCLKCLHNTEGENCHQCGLGYYGSAIHQDCKSKCVFNLKLHLASKSRTFLFQYNFFV